MVESGPSMVESELSMAESELSMADGSPSTADGSFCPAGSYRIRILAPPAARASRPMMAALS
jgi:hypothetical protein